MARKRITNIDMGTIETPVGVLPVEFHVDTKGVCFGGTYANDGTPSTISIPGIKQEYMGWFSCTIGRDGGIASWSNLHGTLYVKRTQKHATDKAKWAAIQAVRPAIEAWVTEHWAEMYRPVLEQELNRLSRLAKSQREQAARRIQTAEEAETSMIAVGARLAAL